MNAASDPILSLASALADRGGLKLWSVVVTLLGDMSQGGTEEVPGPVLSAVVERVGLQAQAMRVALHRLRRDGWVEVRREARLGYYSLSASGRRQTEAVAPLVYGTRAPEGPVRIAVAPSEKGDAAGAFADEPGVLPLTRSVALFAGDGQVPADCLVADLPGAVPDWVAAEIGKAACEAEFRDLVALFRALPPKLSAVPLDAMALRILVLHGWRRLVLRSVPVAEAALGKAAAASEARALTHELLGKLKRPMIAEVADAL